MEMKITIAMDNAAFDGQQGTEVARILRELAGKLEGNNWLGNLNARLFDVNGNRVGEAFTIASQSD
jgi:hypothetical protein